MTDMNGGRRDGAADSTITPASRQPGTKIADGRKEFSERVAPDHPCGVATL